MDNLGDRMKYLEGFESSRRAVIGLPLIVRLDGRSFHTFTKGLNRPFDVDFTTLMQLTTEYLVKETNALIGYTQSDEITLIWNIPSGSTSEYLFGGRYQKIVSILAAMATGYFNKKLPICLPNKVNEIPVFDARAWQVTNLHEAFLTLLWREQDAIKNSITMYALSHFSHKSLNGVNSAAKRKLLRDIGFPWEDLSSEKRKGSYFMRVTEEHELTKEELSNIPEQYRPTEKILRKSVKQVYLPDSWEIKDMNENIINALVFPLFCLQD